MSPPFSLKRLLTRCLVVITFLLAFYLLPSKTAFAAATNLNVTTGCFAGAGFVKFTWNASPSLSGDYWLDVKTPSGSWPTPASPGQDVGKVTSYTWGGLSGVNPIGGFTPGQAYQWRIWDGTAEAYGQDFTAPADCSGSGTAGPPNPQPCSEAVATDNLTDHYITDSGGNPPDSTYTFQVSASGTAGSNVTVTAPASITFTLDLSKLQAIFGSTNSNYLEGYYQDQGHQTENVNSASTQDRDSFFGPGQKAAPKVMTDQLKQKYVNYVYNKPTIAESANKIADTGGNNPLTIYDMVQKWGLPNPDSPSFQSTWGPYWEKIPTSYSEFYEGKLEFRRAFGGDQINKVKNGQSCPLPFSSRTPITFVMPDLFRATTTSGQVNQLIIPKIAQSPGNNLLLASAQTTENVLATIINRCVHLASQNPLTQSLKKVISLLENPVAPPNVYADNSGCVKVLGGGKSGTAPYCALPAGQLPDGACSQPNGDDPNQLDPENKNVVCNITFTYSEQVSLPSSGNGQWDSCSYSGTTVSCKATVAVWPDFRIPWIGEVWNNTLFSDSAESISGTYGSLQETGRPGIYSFFTPGQILNSTNQNPEAAQLQSLVDACKADPPTGPGDLATSGCQALVNWAASGDNPAKYPALNDCITKYLLTPQFLTSCLNLATTSIIADLKKLPGQVGSALGDSTSNVLGVSTGEGQQPFIGSTDCMKTFVRDMALKPLVLQQYLNIDTSCIPKQTDSVTSSGPTIGTPPTPFPTPGPTPTPTPTPTAIPTPTSTPTPTPKPTPTPTPTPATSLTFSWSRPPAFAAFADVAGNTSSCTSTALSCSTPPNTFWPGTFVIYNVHENTSGGAIIKTASALVATGGIATANWDWTYVALAYPNSFPDCYSAGSQCNPQTISSNSSTVSATFTGLTPGTTYREVVCTPNCGTGDIIFSRTAAP